MTRYDELVERLEDAAQPDRPVPEGMRAYREQVLRDATAITDDDVAGLLRAGFTEDEIFEQTVSAAVHAGLERLAAGLEALR